MGRGHLESFLASDTAQQSWNHLFCCLAACQGIFHGVLLGNHPKPWDWETSARQCNGEVAALLFCAWGRALLLTQLQNPRQGQGGFPGEVIPGGSPSGGHQHQLLHQRLAALKEGIKAVPARWAQLSHSTSGRKNGIDCDLLNPDQSPQTFQQGHRIQSEQRGASSHLMQHISELCFFRNSSTAHECLCPCLTRTIGTPTSPAAQSLGYFFSRIAPVLCSGFWVSPHPSPPPLTSISSQQQVGLCLSERSRLPLTMLRIDISVDALPSKTPEIRAKKSTPWR